MRAPAQAALMTSEPSRSPSFSVFQVREESGMVVVDVEGTTARVGTSSASFMLPFPSCGVLKK